MSTPRTKARNRAVLSLCLLMLGALSTSPAFSSECYCLERVVPESTYYYEDASQKLLVGACSISIFDCSESCWGSVTEFYNSSSNAIVCTDCSRQVCWPPSRSAQVLPNQCSQNESLKKAPQ